MIYQVCETTLDTRISNICKEYGILHNHINLRFFIDALLDTVIELTDHNVNIKAPIAICDNVTLMYEISNLDGAITIESANGIDIDNGQMDLFFNLFIKQLEKYFTINSSHKVLFTYFYCIFSEIVNWVVCNNNDLLMIPCDTCIMLFQMGIPISIDYDEINKYELPPFKYIIQLKK